MNRPSLGVALAAMLSTAPAGATPIPLGGEPPTPRGWSPPLWLSLPPIQSTDVLHQEEILSLDPATGMATGRLDISLMAANGSVSSIYFYVDQGLDAVSASSSQASTMLTSELVQGVRFVTITFAPLAEGETMTLSVDYDGVLGCDGGYGLCEIRPDMSVLFAGSLLPSVIDQSNLGGYNVWGASRALELSLPSGTDMVAPGAVTLDVDDGVQHTMRFETPGYHTAAAVLAVFGDFDTVAVDGASPPSTVHGASPVWTADMALWMQDIYAFVDGQAGQPLPWTGTEIVKLPANTVSPGTAAHGLVLLAESYGNHGAAYFEETLAHETAHEWWGILVSPTDYTRSRWLVEGLATLSQIDYAADVLNPEKNREAYVARRYREHDILLRYTAVDSLPAVVPAFPVNAGEDDTLWAYIRSSAALDTLRVLIGEDVFADVLKAWAASCAFEHCDTADFIDVIETTAGMDLTAAFDAYVFGAPFPEPSLSFTQTADSLSVTASGGGVPLPLELWIVFDDRTRKTERVTLVPDEPTVIAIDRPVRAVVPNPRHDAVVRSRSQTDGDVSFDGDVDGFDVITCARSLDTSITPGTGGEGLLRIDLDFLPRCDRNGDGIIAADDMDDLLVRFGAEAPR